MAIKYCLISNGSVILCNYQSSPGDYEEYALHLISQLSLNNTMKKSFAGKNVMFHCIVDNSLVYMCAADAEFGRLKPYSFLNELQAQFTSTSLPMRSQTAGALDFNREFEQTMSTLLEKHSRGEGGDQVSALRSQVDQVKGVMEENVGKVLERGERLDDLIDKTEQLQDSSMTFSRTASRVRRRMWCQNIKTNLCIVGIVVAVLLVLTLVILFSTGVLPPKGGDSNTKTTTTTTQVPPG